MLGPGVPPEQDPAGLCLLRSGKAPIVTNLFPGDALDEVLGNQPIDYVIAVGATGSAPQVLAVFGRQQVGGVRWLLLLLLTRVRGLDRVGQLIHHFPRFVLLLFFSSYWCR